MLSLRRSHRPAEVTGRPAAECARVMPVEPGLQGKLSHRSDLSVDDPLVRRARLSYSADKSWNSFLRLLLPVLQDQPDFAAAASHLKRLTQLDQTGSLFDIFDGFSEKFFAQLRFAEINVQLGGRTTTLATI